MCKKTARRSRRNGCGEITRERVGRVSRKVRLEGSSHSRRAEGASAVARGGGRWQEVLSLPLLSLEDRRPIMSRLQVPVMYTRP